ncbi:MAG: hypothetical protein IT359_01695 [Gemmatimonadaceae bacterium]|nr:hypothetical protein [Gemmatimonadaceae bacterium]
MCIATEVQAAIALQGTVAALLPTALVEAADTALVRTVPDADCLILSAGRLYGVAIALANELRARGFEGPIALVVESPSSVQASDAGRLGIDAVLAESEVALQLPEALLRIVKWGSERESSPRAAAIHASLTRARALMAAGELVTGLQHRLNNPLAALLAEMQLLESEPLAAEHLESVRRMVELCRRVIDVARSIKGLGHEGEQSTSPPEF